jgi:hypothetical protein
MITIALKQVVDNMVKKKKRVAFCVVNLIFSIKVLLGIRELLD